MTLPKNSLFFLVLIVASFFLREIFLVGVFPLFTGQDEARHYNSIQWMSTEQDPACLDDTKVDNTQEKEDLSTYRFSEEIKNASTAAGLSVWREENYRKPAYGLGNTGTNEKIITESSWSKKTTSCPPDIVPAVNSFSFFHWLGNGIEKYLASNTDLLTRFYLIRILSVLLGTLAVVFAYFAATKAGLSRRIALLLTFTFSLQPRFSIYTTNINYDALLLPCFTLFLWAGMRILRQGFTLPNILLLSAAIIFALLTKGTGLILLIGFLFLGMEALFKKREWWKKVPSYGWMVMGVLLLGFIFLLNHRYSLLGLFPQLSFSSLAEYLGKSFPRIPDSSENFWGKLSWTEARLGPWFVYAIWTIEALVVIGLIRFFWIKETLSFLPRKSVVLFCLVLIISLQLGVRVHDWQVYQNTGALLLGTPGRYFLPTLAAQLIVVAVGLGALLRRKIALERALVALALIMIAFNFYTVWLIIIPRFYL